uniref:Uncharacterized protein n=1 Tax=uncultured Desulfobacterium sp. TaxID=201089 RepID=E1YBQ0_9BACT|nr:unknown protein [uncultured Desulfobacterium sp.]CBX30544.1 unknown protein [uncultured Desulfobacterium sp.]
MPIVKPFFKVENISPIMEKIATCLNQLLCHARNEPIVLYSA